MGPATPNIQRHVSGKEHISKIARRGDKNPGDGRHREATANDAARIVQLADRLATINGLSASRRFGGLVQLGAGLVCRKNSWRL